MRRISVFLALAVILLTTAVGYTYRLRLERDRSRHPKPTPKVAQGLEGVANEGWRYEKDDPQTNRPVVRVDAKAFRATHDPSTFALEGLALRMYDKNAGTYTYVKSDHALFDEGSGILKSAGPVRIVTHVPVDKDAEDKNVAAKHVCVLTSGVTYETKTQKAQTDQLATFTFPDGGGSAVGADYDPNTKTLHLKSQIALDWIGKGPQENKIHVEAGDLVYKEAEQKVYLSPWSKMKRQSTTIQAQNSVVILQDGRLHEIDGDHPFGTDDRNDRHVDYSAEKMTAMFDEDGNLIQIVGEKDARVTSSQPGSRTRLTGDRADLRFALATKQENGEERTDSNLHLVMADGHAVARSEPIPQPGVQLSETRILRSEHIELEMKPGGQEVQEIRTPSQAQLEFLPNRPDQSHRIVDASRLRVLYGENSYVDTFQAWDVATHTDKPIDRDKQAAKNQQPAPALTWSDQMTAKFLPNTNQIATILQTGNFRYQEGERKASAKRAFLEQTINRITLTDNAHVLDETGSARADEIVMNQANGDMDASGHVLSTHAPDKNQKPGTSMLDASEPMEATADKMQTRDNNTKVFYQGHVTMWQKANRISANKIDVDRDDQALQATGNVISELVDNKDDNSKAPGADKASSGGQTEDPTKPAGDPIFTTVWAPELSYHDDTRMALYSGGVKLTRDKMTVTAKQVKAYLTPKTTDNSKDSSLDHAFADGEVSISEVLENNRTRTGVGQHCEYYTKEDKVILSGGSPHMVDSRKGITKGQQLTYYSGDDRLITEGQTKQAAFTQMKKK